MNQVKRSRLAPFSPSTAILHGSGYLGDRIWDEMERAGYKLHVIDIPTEGSKP